MLQIGNRAAAANEEARILAKRRGEILKRHSRDQRLPGGRMNVNHVGKMLGIHDVAIAQLHVAACDLDIHVFVRLGNARKNFVRQLIHVLLGKGLDEIVHRAHLKALQRVIGRGRGKDQQAFGIHRAQRLRRFHAVDSRHVNVQKHGGKSPGARIPEKRFAAFVFQKLRLNAAPRQCPFQSAL